MGIGTVAADIPVLPATDGPSSLQDVHVVLRPSPAGIVIKALADGGGRGLWIVRNAGELDDTYRRCAAEARHGFGDPAVFAEVLCEDARHIEVRIVASPTRALALGDRDCSIQRRYRKLIEIAPAQGISAPLRRELHAAATRPVSRAT